MSTDYQPADRRDSSVSSASSQSDQRFVDPVVEFLASRHQSEASQGRDSIRAQPPWYLFQYFRCCDCDPYAGLTPRESPGKYGATHDGSLLGRRKESDLGMDPELATSHMRFSARLTMLVTAFFVAVAQWGALGSGVRFFEDRVGLSEHGASATSSAALAACFLSSIAGGLLGDAIWGNVKTLFVGLVGALSASTLLAFVNFPPFGWANTTAGQTIVAIGMFAFAVSIGLCQTAIPNLVGDQCHHEPQRLQRYYNVYYGLIQSGAFLSRIIFPVMHEELDWFVAICICMTVPAALALLAFTMNASILVHRTPTQQIHAWRAFIIVTRRWLCCTQTDELEVRYGDEEVADAYKASMVLQLHLPLPVFWGLYFQMFVLWYLQAQQLDLTLFHGATISAEQATALNPLFDVILLVSFTGLFALLKNHDVDVRGTVKILLGYICATTAFAYGIWLQVRVANRNQGDDVSVWFQLPQYVFLCAAEVLVYPAALHEVYLRSPTAIRSFMQSCLWFFIGVGNTINVIVLAAYPELQGSNAKDRTQLTPLFIGYAAAMFAATLLYFVIMLRYHSRLDSFIDKPRSISGIEVKTQSAHEPADISVQSFASNHQQQQQQQQTESQRHLHHTNTTTPASTGHPKTPFSATERRIPLSPRTAGTGGAVYHSTRKSPRTSALTSGDFGNNPPK